MHPCDAKGIFFSEVEVLRARQSKGPRDAELHVSLDCACAGPCSGAGVGVAFVSTECLPFCSFMCITFVYVFFSIHSKASFRMHFDSVKKAAHLVAPRGLVVGLRQSRASAPTICLFC